MAWENVVKQTAAGWTANNPTLLDNQIGIESNIISGVETDSGAGKIGNGVTPWNSLGSVSYTHLTLPTKRIV